MSNKYSIDLNPVEIASLLLSLLTFLRITPKTIVSAPWKRIGKGVVNGSKFTELLIGIGTIMWLILAVSVTIFQNSAVVIDYLPSEFNQFSDELKLLIIGLVGFVLVTVIGYAVINMGKLLIKHNPVKNIIEGTLSSNNQK